MIFPIVLSTDIVSLLVVTSSTILVVLDFYRSKLRGLCVHIQVNTVPEMACVGTSIMFGNPRLASPSFSPDPVYYNYSNYHMPPRACNHERLRFVIWADLGQSLKAFGSCDYFWLVPRTSRSIVPRSPHQTPISPMHMPMP